MLLHVINSDPGAFIFISLFTGRISGGFRISHSSISVENKFEMAIFSVVGEVRFIAVSGVDHFEFFTSQLKLLVLRISCVQQSRGGELVVVSFFLHSCRVILSLSEILTIFGFSGNKVT